MIQRLIKYYVIERSPCFKVTTLVFNLKIRNKLHWKYLDFKSFQTSFALCINKSASTNLLGKKMQNPRNNHLVAPSPNQIHLIIFLRFRHSLIHEFKLIFLRLKQFPWIDSKNDNCYHKKQTITCETKVFESLLTWKRKQKK